MSIVGISSLLQATPLTWVRKRPSRIAFVLVVFVLQLITIAAVHAAYKAPGNLKEGWNGQLQLGALATFGAANTSAVSFRGDLTYRGQQLEHQLNVKLYRSANESLVVRRDVNGDEVIDANGTPVHDRIKTTTNNRRFVSAQPRWFFTSVHYLFAHADREINEPANIDTSTRLVGGVGYKLWKSKRDFISAAIGVGYKKLVQVSGESGTDAIGYVGMRLKRKLRDDVSFNLELDSDFGGESRFSEAGASLGWKLSEQVSLKLKYEARFNSKIINPLNTFDDGVEAAFSVNLEVDVF